MRPVWFRLAENKLGRRVTEKIKTIRSFYAVDSVQKQDKTTKLLAETVEFARAQLPYYRDAISSAVAGKVAKDPRYMEEIPVLSKETLIQLGEELIPRSVPREGLKRMKTGGSSGASAYVYYDQDAADWSSATTWFCRSLHESLWNNLHVHFACDFGEEPAGPPTFQQRLHRWALNRENVFTLRFDDQALERYLSTLKSMKPRIAASHPSTMYSIANRAEQLGGDWMGTMSVFESSGERLHDYQRAKISEVFGCPVVNRYGLAEAGVVAYQMDLDSSDMRVMSHLAHFKCEASGAVEDVCITTLRNRAMPLINYQPGDLARFRRDSSRELHISAIEGRIHDQFTVGGVTIMSHSLMDVLDHRVGGVKEFQVHRSRSTNHVKLLVVPERHLDSEAVENAVERYIGARLPVVVADASDLVRVGWRQKFKHLVDVD